MQQQNFFREELAKLLLLQPDEIDEFTKRFFYFVKKNNKDLTKLLIVRGLRIILKDIKSKRKRKNEETFLKGIKHRCLHTHKQKFIELAMKGLGAKAIQNYFKNTLHCKKISTTTIQKALNNLKAKENG